MSLSRAIAFVCLLTLLFASASAAGDNPQRKAENLLAQADRRLAALRDFKAELRARARLSLLPAIELTGHMYFKRPNHLKLEFDHLPSMLSRVQQQLQAAPPYRDPGYTPRWLRTETINGLACEVIELRAKNQERRLQVATIWLDPATGTPPRTDFDYLDGSRASISTRYDKVSSFLLPQTSEVELRTTLVGVRATVTYRDYVLNSNLPDSLFKRQPQ
ncbi:MAG: outer membrane lipoprotein-sorting protein [Proteobacteria bacterium]|nr:outer membrane lipoprotein-sorting protein [Pseudomonadota bacterium]